MLRPLRIRLTLLYLLVAFLLLGGIGGGTYALLRSYFAATTDLALRYRMAQEFTRLGAPLPPELAEAGAVWRSRSPVAPTAAKHEDDDDHDDDHPEDTYDPELLAIFAVSLAADGSILSGGAAIPAGVPEPAAVAAALAQGSDGRTARLAGEPVRLLTYRLPGAGAPALIQLGRPLGDQEQVLRRVLLGLLALGGAGALLLGAGGWWLAGRSLDPLQRSWAQQREFVANAGHELRAPLTLLRASAEVAQRRAGPGGGEQRELLDEVLRECDHMARLVDDLLLLSRLDAGRLPMERRAVPLGPFLNDAARQVALLARERGVAVAAQGPGAALADPLRLRQVLLILLDNALRHTPRGGRVDLAGRVNGRQVEIVVTDTGTGIAPEHLARIFDRFYRVDQGREETGEGSGLGLAIARGLVEAQGGAIRLESRPGEGTRATVTLPRATEGRDGG